MIKGEFECSLVSKITNQRFDLYVRWNKRKYALSVGTPEYIAGLKADNQTLPEKFRDSERIFPFSPLDSVTKVCAQIYQIPEEVLQPYLEPILTEPEG